MRFALSQNDFEFQGVCVSLAISRYRHRNPHDMMSACKMTWTGAATQSLRDAFANKVPVELALVVSSGEPEFSLYINGELQLPGKGLRVNL